MERTLARVVKVVLVIVIAAGASARLLQAQLPQSVGTWLSRGAVADARIGAAAVALDDGRTLVAGGRLADGSVTDGVAIYDPVANSTAVAGQLFAPRVNASATLLADGRVLITGGLVGGVPSADVEIFDLAAGTSTFAATMAEPRAWHAAARLFDDTVLIVGGATADGAALSSAEIFDPETSSIYPAGEMTTPRVGASATATIDHRVLIAGGFNGTQDLATAEIYDAYTSGFTIVPTQMAAARSGHTAVLLPHNAGVLLAGGSAATVAVATTDLFVPATFPDPYSWGMGGFAPTGALSSPRAFAVGGPLGDDGFAYVAGGGPADAETYRFATIKTDKDDYAPGEPAIITGSGWQPGEAVTLTFQEDPAVHDDYSFPVTADALGNIYWDQWAPEEHDLNVRFYLTAQGAVSRAQMTFTDSNLQSVSLLPSNVTVAAGSAAEYTVNIGMGGNTGTCTVTLQVTTTLPTGVGASFNGHVVTATNVNVSRTLTLSTSVTTPPGSYTFTTLAGRGDDCQGSGSGPTVNGTLIVTAPGDSAPPTVSSITRALASPSNAPTLSWTVTFSENVTDVDAADFALSQTGVTGSPAITGVAGGPMVYTVSASTGNGTGTLGLNLNDNDSIRDAADNRLAGTGTGSAGGGGTGNGSLLGQAYSIDRTLMPTFTAASKAYDGNTTATILTRAFTSTLTVSADVSVTGGSATFADANAGIGKTVTATGLGLSGTDAARFVLSSTSATTTAAISRIDANVSVSGYNGVYDGAAHGATGTATGIGGVDLGGGLSLGSSFTDVPGGTAHWTFGGGINYNDQSGDVSVTITAAAATIFVNGYSGVYDAAPHGASLGSAVGVGGADLSASVTIGPEDFTNVPGGTATWSFSNPNYVSQTGTADIIVTAATATVVINGYTGVYDAAAHGASIGSALGVGSVDLSGSVTLGGETFTNVPGGTATWSFSNPNYVSQTGTADIIITPATATIVVNGYTGVYDAAAHGVSIGSALGVGSLDLSGSVTLGGETFTNVPGGTATWSFSNPNYVSQTGTAVISITAATAAIVVNGYTGVYDAAAHGASIGSALGVGSADLSGSVTLGGETFTNVPGGTATWSFSNSNYVSQTGTAVISITAAAATINVAGYTGVYDAAAHGASLVSATGVAGANLTGSVTLGGETFTNVPGGTATWSFANSNYVSQTGTANIVITARPLTVSAIGVNKVYDGTVTATVTLSDDRISGDTFSVSFATATFNDKNVGPAKPVQVTGIAVSGPQAGNYSPNTTASTTANITQRGLTVSGITANDKPFDGNTTATLNTGSAALVGVIAPDIVTLNTAGAAGTFSSSLVGGPYTVSITGLTITGAGAANYSLTQPSTTASITPWTLNGFLQPVGIANTYPNAEPPTANTIWNTIKGGQAVPLKFRLFTIAGGTELTSVSSVQGFALVSLPCGGGAEDPVDVFPTTGSTELRYSDGQFIQNWASPKPARSCYRVTMTAADGSQLSAFFKTK